MPSFYKRLFTNFNHKGYIKIHSLWHETASFPIPFSIEYTVSYLFNTVENVKS